MDRSAALGFLATVLLSACFSTPIAARTITEDDLRGHIAVLSGDDFEGREPGSTGETKTIKYIADTWRKAGLKPAAKDGGWFEPVRLIRRGQGSARYRFLVGERHLRLGSNEIVLIGKEPTYSKSRMPIMFGGYGVKADGSVVDDVAGKVVLVLFDRPENAPENVQSPRARREALVDAGAEGVIFVGDSQGNWPTLRRVHLSRPMGLESREKRAQLEGVMSSEFVVGLVTAAGRDWDRLRQNAKVPNYPGEELGIEADFDVTTDVQRFDSHNVVGKIAGRKKNGGAVMYMGHWDHLGICGPEDAPDRICNGAVDNASGVAVLSEVAEVLAKRRYDRDVYFVATTGEESGLLGAYSYADDPVFPLDEIVIMLNVDTIAVAPKGAKVAIIGRGTTKLDRFVDSVAQKAGRAIEPSTEANSFIPRQDGWALAQKGVPALMVGGSFADLDLMQKFLGSEYHGPNDELTDKTELGGAAEDANLHVELGKYFADARKYKWKKAGD
ncbi:MAG: M28 family peptidase [Sphingorhabdus sp.]